MLKENVVIFLASIVLLSGCIQQAAPPTVMYVCPDGTAVTDKAQCPAAAGEGTAATQFASELAVCAGMPSTQFGSYEDICIIGLAGKEKEASLCARVSQSQRVQCYTLVAEVKNDPDACADAEFQKDACLIQYARDKSDGSVCDKISDVSQKDSCYSDLAGKLGDPELCDKIRNVSQKDSCYLSIAQRLGDSSYCDKITNADQKQHCLQSSGGYRELVVPKP